jgi:hypothetical protein
VSNHLFRADAVRFHAVHWPALLMSAGLEPPRQVLSHAHWTMGKFKMSKSRGNVVDPIAAMDKYGPEPIRWYLMREGGSLPDDSGEFSSPSQSDHRLQPRSAQCKLQCIGAAVWQPAQPGHLAEDCPENGVNHITPPLTGL